MRIVIILDVARHRLLIPPLVALAAVLAMACGAGSGSGLTGKIQAVGAENEYANVLSQIGGRYVQVTAIMTNPSTDPHAFEASPAVAQAVGRSQLVVQNGLGYDGFMTQIENSTPSSSRRVIDVQKVLGLPDSTPNPHLWYRPSTMPAVAGRIAQDLSALQPAHRPYFQHNLRAFDKSLGPWRRAIAGLASRDPGAPVAVTEPVPDYLIQAAGLDDRTPWQLQADVMNGVDLSPQSVTLEENLLRRHQVKALLYNQQVTDSVTQTFLSVAGQSGVPVVGVYETMPPEYTYQSWMLAETRALQRAIEDGTSTQHL
ncbi:MAG: zinc ABC transporter substrate-binding protein [Candidatus Dormibacteraeota bacterium]|nr:zinc ABC transporter substrate-binding protein [Candidatus Dormibacteraeota bacterium]